MTCARPADADNEIIYDLCPPGNADNEAIYDLCPPGTADNEALYALRPPQDDHVPPQGLPALVHGRGQRWRLDYDEYYITLGISTQIVFVFYWVFYTTGGG
jgi:hypothetical protein